MPPTRGGRGCGRGGCLSRSSVPFKRSYSSPTTVIGGENRVSTRLNKSSRSIEKNDGLKRSVYSHRKLKFLQYIPFRDDHFRIYVSDLLSRQNISNFESCFSLILSKKFLLFLP